MVRKILLLKQYLMNSHGSTIMFSRYVNFYYHYSFMLGMKQMSQFTPMGSPYLISNLVFNFHSSFKDCYNMYWLVLLNGNDAVEFVN